MCLCSVNKDADQIHSYMICTFASVQNIGFFHDSLHLFISHAEFYLLGHSMYLCYETPQ